MKPLLTALLAALLIAAVVIVWIQHQSQEKLRVEISSLNDQNAQLNASAENLSNLVAQGGSSQAASKQQLNELLKLRGEVSLLRNQAGQLGKVRDENQQLRARAAASPASPTQNSPLSEEDQFHLQEWHTVNALKQLGLAMKIYAGDNNENYATNFDQLTNELSNVTNFPGNISLDTFEFMNVGVANGNTPQLMIFRERTPRQTPNGAWSRVYGLADGSVQTRYSDDGNFDKPDQEYSPPPANQ